MATPKSANERIRRKVRRTKVTPDGKDIDSKVTVKKPADNDPRRNKPEGISEDFLRLYKGQEVENVGRFRSLIDNMINVAVEAAGEVNFPFNLSRLQELQQLVKGSVPLVIKQKVLEPREAHICPHCNEEIGEKESFIPEEYRRSEDLVMVHRPCGGLYKYPKVNMGDGGE